MLRERVNIMEMVSTNVRLLDEGGCNLDDYLLLHEKQILQKYFFLLIPFLRYFSHLKNNNC